MRCDSTHPTSENCAQFVPGRESIYSFSKISDLTCPRPTPVPPTAEHASCCVGLRTLCPDRGPPPHPGGNDADGPKCKPESDTGSKLLIAIAVGVISLGVGVVVGAVTGAKCLRGSKMESLLDSHLNTQIDGSE